ncbi:GNAT family N-acetyltransferase [Nitratireductor mangrovi]|uniref:GNAT family N-acetyltransferase n=1 Tax=Nitratireductor mangrovi TaxID=2599600 RepID=A0A5B8L5D3_9HYPH|nr:GNAT family N-acetyltransferase [Nitratireductor mangrovi]QDZ02943.1 GNAT family N-acetyltransferase [Nitratireductor mangrovi]
MPLQALADHAAKHGHPRPVAGACVVALEASFDFRTSEYARLFDQSDATAFQHPIWLDALYRQLAPRRGAEKVVVTGRDRETGELLFLLPLLRRRKSGVILLEATDLGVSDYAAPVCDRRFRAEAGLAPDVRAVLPAFDTLRIRPVRGEHVAAWQFFLGGDAVRQDFSAHAVMLSPDFGAWRENALAPSFRKMLDRKKKRFLKQDGASVRLLRDDGELRDAIAAIARLRAGRFEGDLIQSGYVADFYARIAAEGSAAGLSRTYAIALGGEPIGFAFGLTHAGNFNYLLIGCDYDAHGRHSPGLILYDSMIEDWIASGGKIFDFTIGDEAFKKEFGTAETAIYEISDCATWRGRLARAGLAAREGLRRMRETRKDG